jgi:hypothetical protein
VGVSEDFYCATCAKKKEERKMTKKKTSPVFGQMTLTGSLALDWMKDGMEIEVVRLEIGPIGAFSSYNLPEWIGEKTGDLALLHPKDTWLNPVLVTQRSILRQLEMWAVEKEAAGAETSVETRNKSQIGVLDLAEGSVALRFSRDKSKGKFAPYQVEEILD